MLGSETWRVAEKVLPNKKLQRDKINGMLLYKEAARNDDGVWGVGRMRSTKGKTTRGPRVYKNGGKKW